jgi:hypothetical protein
VIAVAWLCAASAVAQPASDRPRPHFRGLYPGMPASELPSSLRRTGDIGQLAGFIGEDFVEAFVWYDVLSQLSIVYVAPASGTRPKIDRKLTLQDAWRLHSVGSDVPEFGLYMTHLYLVDGLIDARNLIVYRLQFANRMWTRDAPPLFDPQTRVERVVLFKDRSDLASNYQPIASSALLKVIGERYRDTFSR